MLEGDLMEEKRNILLDFSRDVKSILENKFNYWIGAVLFYNNVKKDGGVIGE